MCHCKVCLNNPSKECRAYHLLKGILFYGIRRKMNGICCLRMEWRSKEIISLQKNISVNFTEEILSSPSVKPVTIMFFVLTCAFEFVGILGSILSLVVLVRPPVKSPFSCCLMFMAVYDAIFLICLFVKDVIGGTPKSLASFTILQSLAWTGVVWTTFSLTVERSIGIFWVLKAKSLCTYKRTVWLNILVLCIVAFFNIPLIFVLYNISWKGESMKSYTHFHDMYEHRAAPLIPLWFFQNRILFKYIYVYLNVVGIYCVPLLFASFLRISICIALAKAQRTRREMCHCRGRKALYKFEVFNVLFNVFFLTHFLALLFSISYQSASLPIFTYVTESFSYVLFSFNCSLKFPVCYIIWKDFRDTTRSLFHIRRIHNVVYDDNSIRMNSL